MSLRHKSTVSAELPDYLLVKQELTKVSPVPLLSSKGRKAILSQVSCEAPSAFLLPFVQPSSPLVRQQFFQYSELQAQSRTSRHNDHHRVFTYTDYVNLGPVEDYSSLPLGKGVDIEKGTDAGRRRKLPFYKLHEVAARRKDFHLHLGLFTHTANQPVIGRADTGLRRSLGATVRTNRTERTVESLAREKGREALNLTIATSRPETFDRRALKQVLRGRWRGMRAKSTGGDRDFDPIQAINHFDQQRAQDSAPHPVTRKTLGSIY